MTMQAIFVFISFVFGLAIAVSSLPKNDLINYDQSVHLSRAGNSDLTYYFYSRFNRDGITWTFGGTNSIPNIFDPKKETLFIIHGWLDKYSSPSVTLITTATLDIYDINVVAVDWSPIAGDVNYLAAKDGVPNIGLFFGNFLRNLTTTYDIPPSTISMVGHSLGAHIAGIAGTMLNSDIDHITGLDPAAPFIDVSDTNYVLDPTDARFVQVIHTSGGKLGIKKSLGHADYYPNGGSEQPGCIFDIFGNCAHKRAYKYFAESVSDNKFFSQSCSSYDQFSKRSCNGDISLMGGYYINKEASGKYYLKTSNDSPYALGETE